MNNGSFLILSIMKRDMSVFRLLGIPLLELERLINQPQYKVYKIPKKRGGWRGISAPETELKIAQQKVNKYLQSCYSRIKPDEVYVFVRMKQSNIVANARPHINKPFLLNLDLKDFFPCITAKRVKEMFLSEPFQFNEQAAIAFTLLTTYQGRLPTGAPSSPIISNLVCRAFDKDLADFSKAHQLVYTRYADDLTFSSDLLITKEIISDIVGLIEKHHFRINEKKFRLISAQRQQMVTGIVVNKKINVDRKMLKKIRAMLHDWQVNGLNAASRHHFWREIGEDGTPQQFLNRLIGYINFVGQVRGKYDTIFCQFENQYRTNM
jgi:RNA-directed DNA polymerase